jgi:lysozyme family protein
LSRDPAINRRVFGAGVAAAAASSVLPAIPALGQTAATPGVSANPWQELGALSARARELKLSVPRVSSLAATGGTSFSDVLPAVVGFIDHIESSASSSAAAPADVDALLDRASDLLISITSAERSPRNGPDPNEPGLQATSYTFEALKDDYLKLFNSCVISEQHRTMVNWYVTKLTDANGDQSYDNVEDAICAPWYFIGIIHGLEASFNFKAHLHNGDPLKARTVQVPAGRPPVWLPPSDWASSAEDALTLEKFSDQSDWSLAEMLYRFEKYNGFGSRSHGINTPYLWAFSNHYAKGKYVADGKWNPDAVSQQCGAAVMLKALVEAGKIAQPS